MASHLQGRERQGRVTRQQGRRCKQSRSYVRRSPGHGAGGLRRLRQGQAKFFARVMAAGINFKDTQFRSGLYAGEPPVSLGSEGAGIVEAIGSDVADLKPGDRVCWMYSTGHRPPAHGSYATQAIVPANNVVPLPPGLDFQKAAAVLFQGVTAHYLSHSTYPLVAGETCLVHSAAGGVGSLLCQMAKMRGAL